MQEALPTLDPVDYRIVHRAFTILVHAEWFDRTGDNIALAAKLIIAQFTPGLTVEDLVAKSEPLLRASFSLNHIPAT